jgi:hypothetical protein
VRLVRDQPEAAAVEGGEECVGRKFGIDLGQLERVGDRHREGVQLGAADHVHARRRRGTAQRLFE